MHSKLQNKHGFTYEQVDYNKMIQFKPITTKKSKEIAQKCSKMTKSRKTTEKHQKFDFGTKNNNTSSHILLDHSNAFGLSFYAAGLKKFLKVGTPRGTFWPALDPPLDGSG